MIVRKFNKLTDIIKKGKSANDYLTHTERGKLWNKSNSCAKINVNVDL